MSPFAMNLSVTAMLEAVEATEARLQTARESFPGWRILEAPDGGYLAVPANAGWVDANSLDELVAKLRQQ